MEKGASAMPVSYRVKQAACSAICLAIIISVILWFNLLRSSFTNLKPSSDIDISHALFPPIPWAEYTSLYVFGDSWSSTKFDHNGRQPSAENPFGNPPFPDDRPEGPHWVHYMTERYNDSALMTYDLAKSGAVIDTEAITSEYKSEGTSFNIQVNDEFMKRYARDFFSGEVRHDWDVDTTLFAIWFGSGELAIAYHEHEAVPIAPIFKSFRQTLKTLYDGGARRLLLLTVPPLQRARNPRTDTSSYEIQIHDWNRELRILAEDINTSEEDFAEARLLLFDAYAALEHLSNAPESMPSTKNLRKMNQPCDAYAFGLKNAMEKVPSWGENEWPDHHAKTCDEPLSRYFWMNWLHVTYPVHEALAQMVVDDCFGLDGIPKRFCAR